ncbi:MAG TPA: peptidyl-prolyl cis-trans isomerase [Nitrospirota bacterium]|nr:peptidyl-prolyl cis-trans isomerase [Nitrospirota bacterium]
MKRPILSLIAVLGMLFSYSLQSTASGSVVVDRVVAVVNGEIITMSDLQREEALKKTDKPDERLLLEDMIDRKLQMAAAKRAGMDVTDKELADAVEDIMKRNSMDSKQFEAALAKEGLTLEQYKIELREQMTLSRVFNKYVRSGLAVDEAEVRAYYEKNKKTYSMPEEIRVRHIFFKLPEDATPAQTEAVKEKALEALERAKKGQDFIRLVEELSESENADQGGDLGFMQRDQVIPEIEEATRTLKPGELAGPIQCAGGFHVIRLEEIRTQVKPFEKVKDEIAKMLYEQKSENTYRTWLQTLRSDSLIENRL